MNRTPLFVLALFALLALSAFALVAGAQPQQRLGYTPALVSLVEAERSFARTSVERGVREAFLAFFADDGINFQPHPTNTREAYLKRPAPAVRPPVTLYWDPVFADVSRAGDLGYTTGPYRLSDQSAERKPTRHGYYFSIWKRQPDGAWKVALDVGIQTPEPDAAERAIRFQAAPQQISPAKKAAAGDADFDPERARAILLKTDRDFLGEANARGALKAYQTYLGDEARLHRDRMFPLTTKELIRAHLSRNRSALSGEPMSADVARSNDLGYTYGRYELREGGGGGGGGAAQTTAAAAEKGYYVRVWKRERAGGRWKIALDTMHPLPPGEK